MNKVQLVARIILGLIYFVFGGMGLLMALGLIHMTPPAMPEAAEGFMKGIMGTGYFFPMLKIIETACGLLILIGIFVPVALVIIAPVTLNIFLFHMYLTPEINELILPSIMVLVQIIAMSGYWNKYKGLFKK